MRTNDFLFNLSQVLAHTLVYESKRPFTLNALCDPKAPSASESTAQMLEAYTKYLPGFVQALGGQILPLEKAMLDANKELSPQQNQLQLDIASQFLPKFTELGNKVSGQSALQQAQNDLAVLQGPGKELTAAALEAQKQADAPYYATRDRTATALQQLMGSLDDPNGGLSGSEQAEVDRRLAQENAAAGRTGVQTAQGTVQAAMEAGAAGAARKSQKQQAIANAVSAASNALPTFKSGIDIGALTLNRPMFTNPAEGQFAGATKAGDATQNLGGQVLGQIGTAQNTATGVNAQRRNWMDMVNQGISSINCCWTFAEAYGGWHKIPWFVRAVRDSAATPEIRRGYKRFSCIVVPLMRLSKRFRALVMRTLIVPLTEHAGYCTATPGYERGNQFHNRSAFWLKTWKLLGSI